MVNPIENSEHLQWQCICPDGIIGRTCDQKTACFNNPCGDGNKCILTDDDTFQCQCQVGLLGQLCTIEDLCVDDEKVYSVTTLLTT